MTSLPDWLVERAALDQVPPGSRARVDAADPAELEQRIAALRADNAAELAAYPAGPALAQIEARVASAAKRRTARRLGILVGVASAAVLVLVGGFVFRHTGTIAEPPNVIDGSDGIRVKGVTRLIAYRQTGQRAELLTEDALVRERDLIQIRYDAGGARHGIIASIDGAGVVTLHHPGSDDAPTELAAKPTSLPHAYALDDAPDFERFFFITADDPIDIQRTLGALRALARRADSSVAQLELPAGVHQWSLRLRKPSSNNR